MGIRVVGNAAMSLDGRLALPGHRRAKLSSREDKVRVHRLRHEVDAILVGAGTVLADDPELLVDPALAGIPDPDHPLRVVLDGRLRTPPQARVLGGPAPTLLCTTEAHAGQRREGAEVVAAGKDRVHLDAVLAALEARGCRSLLVEGGGHVHGSFLAAGLYEAFTVYVAPLVLGGGPSLVEGLGPGAPEVGTVDDAPRLRLTGSRVLGAGLLMEFARP